MKNSWIIGIILVLLVAVAATAGLVTVDSPIITDAETSDDLGPLASVQSDIDDGKAYLAAHNILAARDKFKSAYEADSTNQEANLLYGVTRVFAVVEDGQTLTTTGLDSVREILELSGFLFSQFNIYGSSYTAPDEFPNTTPHTGEVFDFLNNKLLSEVNGAIANLNAVTNTAFSSVIDPSAIDKGTGISITIDYADALVIKSLLQLLKCNLELLMVYGLNVSLPDIQAGKEQLNTYRQFFVNDSTFLTPKNPSRLATAKTALIAFIDNYSSAAQSLKNRSGSAHHLFVVDVPVTNEVTEITSSKLDDINEDLVKLKTGLNGGTYQLPISKMKDRDRFVDLSKFFDSDHPINFRSQLANCTSGTVLADPTIGGLFPLGLTAAFSPGLPSIAADILGVACTSRGTPLLEFDPGSIFLQDDSYYSNIPQYLTISNRGTANLSITSVNLVGLNSSEFTLDPGTCSSSFPAILAPGASCTAIVSLNEPYNYSWLVADIEFNSDDISSPYSYVNLWGYTSAVGTSPSPNGSYNLTVNNSGTGTGSVTYWGYSYDNFWYPPVSCSGSCGTFETGADIQLDPIPSPGSYFTGWSGCDSVEDETCNVKMYSAKNVTASFTRDNRTLTVMAFPPGGAYTGPQTVTLAANKESTIYYTLDGGLTGYQYSGPFLLSSPATLMYVAVDPYNTQSEIKTEVYTGWTNPTLTVNTDGSGGGTINSTSPQSGLIVCSRPSQPGDICATTQTSGTVVTLSATPDSTSIFSGWSVGSCPGTDPCSLTLNSDTTVTGTFATMPPVKVETSGYPTTYHSTIQDAFAHTYANSIIRLQGGDIYEMNPSFNQSFQISIIGGYDAEFDSHPDYSYFQDMFTIVTGSAIIDRLIIK